MISWWNALTLLQQVFYLIAIPSTLVLLLQTLLLLFGLGGSGDQDVDTGDLDSDFDGDLDDDLDGGFVESHDSFQDYGADHAGGMRLLTVRGIVAFLSVGGWIGLTALETSLPVWAAMFIALLAGLAALFAVAMFLRFSLKLQQNGNLDLRNAIGVVGEAYMPIPTGGRGKVTLMLQERLTELDATTLSDTIPTGRTVKVVDIIGETLLVVEPLMVSSSQQPTYRKDCLS